jgi:hypothetical protein
MPFSHHARSGGRWEQVPVDLSGPTNQKVGKRAPCVTSSKIDDPARIVLRISHACLDPFYISPKFEGLPSSNHREVVGPLENIRKPS